MTPSGLPIEIDLPDGTLVVLVGASGSGKSTFARRFFRATEVLSSDAMRAMVADDENDQSASDDAFDVLHYVAGKRLAAGRLTVIDATNVRPESRRPLVAIARHHRAPIVAVVLDTPAEVCTERNRTRRDRSVPGDVLARHRRSLARSIDGLAAEGFARIWILGPADVDRVVVLRDRS